MSTIPELQAQLDIDLKIDPSNLMAESAENLLKHSKYFHQLIAHKAKVKAANLELNELVAKRYNYYAGIILNPGDDTCVWNMDRTATKYNLEGDKEVIRKQQGILVIQLKVEFFEKACDLMVSRGFAIKNMIELMKFQHGE